MAVNDAPDVVVKDENNGGAMKNDKNKNKQEAQNKNKQNPQHKKMESDKEKLEKLGFAHVGLS